MTEDYTVEELEARLNVLKAQRTRPQHSDFDYEAFMGYVGDMPHDEAAARAYISQGDSTPDWLLEAAAVHPRAPRVGSLGEHDMPDHLTKLAIEAEPRPRFRPGAFDEHSSPERLAQIAAEVEVDPRFPPGASDEEVRTALLAQHASEGRRRVTSGYIDPWEVATRKPGTKKSLRREIRANRRRTEAFERSMPDICS